jgi:hypothetical protein
VRRSRARHGDLPIPESPLGGNLKGGPGAVGIVTGAKAVPKLFECRTPVAPGICAPSERSTAPPSPGPTGPSGETRQTAAAALRAPAWAHLAHREGQRMCQRPARSRIADHVAGACLAERRHAGWGLVPRPTVNPGCQRTPAIGALHLSKRGRAYGAGINPMGDNAMTSCKRSYWKELTAERSPRRCRRRVREEAALERVRRGKDQRLVPSTHTTLGALLKGE